MHNKPGYGTLIDLDHAICVDGLSLHGDDKVAPVPSPAVGTPSFMAVDLHSEENALPAKHYYRFELESFFYSLAWIATHYHFGKMSWSSALGEWLSGDDQKVVASKRQFMAACASDSYEYSWSSDVSAKWLPRLGTLFHDAFTARDEAREVGSDFDDETLGGRVTYETFLKVLEEND